MKQIRVLEIAKSTAGVAEYVRWLVQGLDRSKFELTVVCLSEGSEAFSRELTQTYHIKAYNLAMDRYRVNLLSDTSVFIALWKILRSEKFDLIHVHASKPGFLARLAALGLKIPTIYSPHCFSFHRGVGKFKSNILALLERIAARYLTTRILVVAASEIKLAQAYNVGSPDQFVAINSGIDIQPFQQPVDRALQRSAMLLKDAEFVVGTVGRLSEQKAPLDFVQAAAILAPKYPGLTFAWIGDGPLLQEAQNLSQKLNLTQRIRFLGLRKDIPACLAALDCFVLVSRWEGFPLVVLEAMAAGLPIVATNIDGTNDAIQHDEDGLLVPPGDVHAIADAIEKIYLDHALSKRLADAGRLKASERFTRKKMLDAISSVYTKTAQGGAK